MNNMMRIKLKLKTLMLISIVLITSVFGAFLMNIASTSSSIEGSTLNNDQPNDRFKKNEPIASLLGTHTWWDKSFHSRQVINITNPYSVGLNNYGVSISFNYSTLTNSGNMNSSLKDIRIIEYDSEGNPYQRKYYFEKDYPGTDNVTVWFNTNVSAGASELDTYLYYGNDNIEINTTYFMNETSDGVANNFGWVRNGNFEQDVKAGTRIDDVFGWYYADDAPSDLTGVAPSTVDINTYQHNLSNTLDGQEHVQEGNYAFKFGDIANSVASGGSGDDIMGTLYSTPFVVPEVSGGSVSIRAWRNLRIYDNQNNKLFYYKTRICNTFSTDIDSQVSLSNIEGWETISKNGKPNTVIDSFGATEINTAGDLLMNYITYEIPEQYEGTTLFLQFTVYVIDQEFAGFGSFLQVDDVKFNYTLHVDLEPEVERRKSDVTIIVRDVDGRIIPNAEVSLVNSTAPIAEQIKYGPINSSTDEGIALFTGVIYKNYNITVNYTIPNTNFEAVVYNGSSNVYPDGYDITQAQHTFEIYVDIWTIDFEMVDYDEEPLNYGYVAVYNNTDNTENLVNLTLDSNGKATFRWKNQSSYYYEVYYDNIDYSLNPTQLNSSRIKRDKYDTIGEKIRKHSILLNTTILKDAPTFTINQTFYTDGSLIELGNKMINSAKINITTQRATTTVTSISVYYIDKNGYSDDNYRIYYNNTAGADWYRLNIDMRNPSDSDGGETPATLAGDMYGVYGLRVVATGTNTSRVWGDLNVTLFETTNIYNVTDLVKVNVRVINEVGVGIVDVLVNVNSSIFSTNDFNVVLETRDNVDDNLKGYAYGQINTQVPLWFLRGNTYNFTLNFFGSHKALYVNYTDPHEPVDPDTPLFFYNYTATQKSNITFELYWGGGGVNSSWFQTSFEDTSIVDSVIWGELVTVQTNFTSTDDNWETSSPISLPASVTCYVISTGEGSSTLLQYDMNSIGNGIFRVNFSSSLLSAGDRGELYSIIIAGSKSGYSSPTNATDSVFIDAITSLLTMHDYYDSLNSITETDVTYGEIVNLTFRYYKSPNTALLGATLTYKWLYLDAIQFYEDPLNPGYYTTTINTSVAEVWGLKSIEITAMQENHTTQTFFTSLSITERTTSLNGEFDLVYVSTKVWVQDPNPFEFEYQDIMTSENIGNLTSATYIWEQLYPNGTRIPGLHGSGSLVQNINTSHILDFKTELKEIGNYYLYITLHKQNYKPKSALINLEILSREFSYALEPGKIVEGIMEIENGDSLDLSMSLHDLTRNITLQGATVSMSFQDVNYNFTEGGSGTYSVDITDYTRLDELATSETSTTDIIISKPNFTTQIIEVTVLLNNRIFDYEFTDEFNENLVVVISGDSLSFDVTLENSKDQSLIIDATLSLTIDEQPYDLDIVNNEDGSYTFNFLKNYPKAFTSDKAISGEIIIQRTNYKTENIPITIQIKMEEVFPNVPTFYFILITAAVIGVVGSIVAYRVIQQARIPNHVKKIRKVKSLIKSKKKIADIASVPSKNEMIAKIFRDEWKTIGLEIGDALGLKDIKAKKISIKETKEPKEKIKKEKIKKEKVSKEKIKKEKVPKEKKQKEEVPKEKKEAVNEDEKQNERGESN